MKKLDTRSTLGRDIREDAVETWETTWDVFRGQINAGLQFYVLQDRECPPRLQQAMSYSLLAGGKRLRPVLVMLACEACGGDPQQALPAACALEMVHTYSLIHDDLPAMDDDDLRRGRPTNHKIFGEALAILAGDALLTLAFEVIATRIVPPEVAAACCADLANSAGAVGMVAGQVADLEAEALGNVPQVSAIDSPPDVTPLLESGMPARSPVNAAGKNSTAESLEILEAIHRRKTGRLLCSALTLGARVARADPETLTRLSKYGLLIGLAFQITDDLLDIRGNVEKVGKGVNKDAALGKLTYPSLLGVEASERRAQSLIAEACGLIEPFGDRGRMLRELAQFILNRDH